MQVPYHGKRHQEDDEVGDDPRYWRDNSEKVLVAAVSSHRGVPITLNGNTDQAVCEESADPP